MEYIKVYVLTVVEFSADGKMKPLYIEWENGQKYYIDKVYAIKYSPANVGAELPVRYDCDFSGRRRYLYYEDSLKRWFIEQPVSRR